MARRTNGDGSVFYDEERDRWMGRIPKTLQHPGLKKTVVGTSKSDATRKLRALRDEHVTARAANRRQFGEMTVAELCDKYSRKRPKASAPKSTSRDEWIFAKINQVLAERIVSQLRVADVDEALEALYNQDVRAKSSLSRVRSMLSAMFDFAIDREWCERNPAARAALPNEAKPTREGIALKEDECVRLLAELEAHPMYAMFIVMLLLGLRPGEAAGLTTKDIDLDKALLHVRRNLVYNDHGSPVKLDQVKTGNRGKGRRTLRLPIVAVDAFSKRLDALALQVAVYGDKWDGKWADVIFVTDDGNPPGMTYHNKVWRQAIEKCGLPKNVRRYDARHTAASLMADQGATLEELADMLGHEDTRMARIIYTHAQGPRVIEGGVDLGL